MKNNQTEEMSNIIAVKAFEQAHLINGDENLIGYIAELKKKYTKEE